VSSQRLARPELERRQPRVITLLAAFGLVALGLLLVGVGVLIGLNLNHAVSAPVVAGVAVTSAPVTPTGQTASVAPTSPAASRLTPQAVAAASRTALDIPLPKAMTATPLPLKPVTFTFDNASATQAAEQVIQDQGLPIGQVSVTFAHDHLELTGAVSGLAGLPGSSSSSSPGQLAASAAPVIVNDELHWHVQSATVDGRDLSVPGVTANLERALDETFLSFLSGRWVKQATITDGLLTVQALERQ
jgi:hypothetical protein